MLVTITLALLTPLRYLYRSAEKPATCPHRQTGHQEKTAAVIATNIAQCIAHQSEASGTSLLHNRYPQ